MLILSIINARLNGSRDVHVSDIKRSYRMRGNVARVMIKINIIIRD